MLERDASGAPTVHSAQPDPDQVVLSKTQVARLSALSGIETAALEGQSVVQIADKLRWRIDPAFLMFRRVCGRVVKRDPVTGQLYPVPFATVYVEDTDSSFLWYSPSGHPWSWAFPFRTRREVIATTVTDACGHFCVWIPRFDIDWVLRWRRERRCFPEVFLKPNLRDLLERLPVPIPWPPVPPIPQPDPPPFRIDPAVLLNRESIVGRERALKLASFETNARFAERVSMHDELLESPAFTKPLPPPAFPAEARTALVAGDEAKIAATLAVLPSAVGQLRPALDRYIGPFLRCYDVFVPTFVPIVDVPDITFRVGQDVDGDGDEETIYSEGFFDVRWDAGAIPDVTLEASPIARAAVSCDIPDVPCADVPALVSVGKLMLAQGSSNGFHNATTGYALRPNRPHPSGSFTDPLPNPAATAPFHDDLDIRGCLHNAVGAHYYRLHYRYNGGPRVPLLAQHWDQIRNLASRPPASDAVVSDALGWYPVDTAKRAVWMDPHLLLHWNTNAFADGNYVFDLELGDASKNVLNPPGSTVPIAIRVDNSRPSVGVSVEWRYAGFGPYQPLHFPCPTVSRPVGQALEFRVTYSAAAQHLRSARVWGTGCGGDDPTLPGVLPAAWEAVGASLLRHWHQSSFDNNEGGSVVFHLPASAPQGVYGFNVDAYTRAFNPLGADNGDESAWEYDPADIYNHTGVSFAVIDS